MTDRTPPSPPSSIRLPEARDPDYLWDRSGAPDPEVARLESLLSVYRHRAPAPSIPEHAPPPLRLRPAFVAAPTPTPARPRRLAIAAMIGLGVFAAFLCPSPATPFHVESLSGTPSLGHSTVTASEPLRAGQWLETNASSRARIQIADMGEVRIGPLSLLRVRPASGGLRLLDLARGTIHASVTAKPRLFMVDTPYARAVDLGCEYTLTVDPSGAGEIRVVLGYVQLEYRGLTSIIPMNGGMCLTRPGVGPGTPFFEDATPRFKDELRRFDFDAAGEPALLIVLSEARAQDALSLWHLLQRVDDRALRAEVYDRLSQLKPPPESVIRSGVLALDHAMLEQWWDAMRPF